MTQRYPLLWPAGWPRTKPSERQSGKFRHGGTQGLSMHQAATRVLEELRRFTKFGHPWRIDPDDAILSTNVKLRMDGFPRSDQPLPGDPGAALYFEFDGDPRVVPCDRYDRVEQNVAGIAATLDALRALERHGSGIMERAFTGFEALPHLAESPWYDVLGLPPDAPPALVVRQYQKLRSDHHPDRGGDPYQFDRVIKAYLRWEKEQSNGQ